MEKTKLIGVLKVLSKKELRQLRQFVRSPFHNRNKDVINLCEYLLKLAPKWETKYIEKEFVFGQIKPKVRYNDLKMRHITSNFFKVLEDFLAYTDYAEQAINPQLHLLRAYRKHQLDKHFEATLQNSRKIQEDSRVWQEYYFFHQYAIELEYNQFLENQHQRHIEPNLQALSYSLDSFYLLHKLKCACRLLYHQHLANKEATQGQKELDLLAELLHYLKTNWQNYPSAIVIYYHVLLTLVEEGNSEHFYQLKALINQYRHQFTLTDLHDIYVFARSYCIKKLNNGDRSFVSELFELYKTEIEQATILEDNILPPLIYKNVLVLGLSLKEYDWIEWFIEMYKDKLPENLREHTYRFAWASLFFAKKQYQKVIDLLSSVTYNELFLGLDARKLLLKAYYELGEQAALDTFLDGFRIYLKRKNNLLRHKNGYVNLIEFVQQLSSINKEDEEAVKVLNEGVLQTVDLAEKDWLVRKVGEFGSRG